MSDSEMSILEMLEDIERRAAFIAIDSSSLFEALGNALVEGEALSREIDALLKQHPSQE